MTAVTIDPTTSINPSLLWPLGAIHERGGVHIGMTAVQAFQVCNLPLFDFWLRVRGWSLQEWNALTTLRTVNDEIPFVRLNLLGHHRLLRIALKAPSAQS
jgi:hypothetical protein